MTTERTGAERYRAQRMTDPEFRKAYEAARSRIDAIDSVMRALDERREQLGLTKAEMARRAGMRPAAVRRLFSAQRPNPTLETVLALADVLELELRPAPRNRARTVKRGQSGAARTPQPVA